MKKKEYFTGKDFLIFLGALFISALICLSLGSVSIPFDKMLTVLFSKISGQIVRGPHSSIIWSVRLPRVINATLVGASLAVSGATMQGLLKNPLAEGGTLGVSAGAGLGAVLAIALSFSLPVFPLAGTVVMAMTFAFFSMVIILYLSYKLDYGLSTNTIILLGVIYSMFVTSIQSFIIVFSSDKLESITTWTMGSLANSSYKGALIIALVFTVFFINIYSKSRELDAFAISERNAAHLGVDVKKVKYSLMISVSAIIGVSVAFSGSIGFVGLIIPHIMRKIVGPAHGKLLMASAFGGAIFLLFADLMARTIMSPVELPIGIITSFLGAILFVNIYFSMGKVN